MHNTADFYSSGDGDLLIDHANYPDEIRRYLQDEVNLLNSIKDKFGRLVEVGCMEARHLDWCIRNEKKYLGRAWARKTCSMQNQ